MQVNTIDNVDTVIYNESAQEVVSGNPRRVPVPAHGSRTAGCMVRKAFGRAARSTPVHKQAARGGNLMVKMKVKSVGILRDSEEPVLVLEEQAGKRVLAIGISLDDAAAIAYHLEGCHPPRPLVHDLLATTVRRLGGEVLRVTIHDFREDAFSAIMDLASADSGVMELETRPSDGIALAVRTGAPVYCTEEVLASVAASSSEKRIGEAGHSN